MVEEMLPHTLKVNYLICKISCSLLDGRESLMSLVHSLIALNSK